MTRVTDRWFTKLAIFDLFGLYFFGQPEISVKNAKTRARDLFQKASSSGLEIGAQRRVSSEDLTKL